MRDDPSLAPREANFRPLTPLDLLDAAIGAHGSAPAVVWRGQSWSYQDLGAITARLCAALQERGIGPGDVVSVICGNRPEMLAAHFAVPALGAVLNAVNTRLDAASVAYILSHSGSRLLIAAPDCAATAADAAKEAGVPLQLLSDEGTGGEGLSILAGAAPALPDWTAAITDEWQPIAINYTSGTTGQPKGAVLHHRGAYLNALGNVMALGLGAGSRYLWTLPMFHCNGWCHTWAVTAAGGLHVCLDRVEPRPVFEAIRDHGVTHMSCAPVVLYMLLNDPARELRDPAARMTVASGGAAPTETLITQMDALGFDFLHLYGLTESYGPATLRRLSAEEAGRDAGARAQLLAQQGVRHPTAGHVHVLDGAGHEVPADGETVGEIVLRGNTLMAGYYRDPEATGAALGGGGLRTGDLAVRQPGGQIAIRDRAKDVIISGGENISSLEVEDVLHRHPSVLLAAVVAAPDEKWGEIPCAFVELREGQTGDAAALEAHCRAHLPGFKIPRRFVFGPLPRTATGKIQKFVLRSQAAGES